MSDDPLSKWRIENLRFTVFLLDSEEPEPLDSWKDIVGQDVDDTHIKGTVEQRVVSQQGPFRGSVMRADFGRNRIDWHLLPQPSNDSRERPTAGTYGKFKDSFYDAMLNWLYAAHPVVGRMAYGAVLSRESGTRRDCVSILSRLINTVKLDSEFTWDFEYSINRRRASKSVENLKINRLAKWTMGQQNFGVIELPVSGQPRLRSTSVSYFPSLTLDINTAPEFSNDLDQPRAVLNELISLGTEIALQGDVS